MAEVTFDGELRARLRAVLGGVPGLGEVPVLATGAGHDAGLLAGELPTAMLFVRNPTGVSHAPAETAAEEDCRTGADALAAVLAALACPRKGALIPHDATERLTDWGVCWRRLGSRCSGRRSGRGSRAG